MQPLIRDFAFELERRFAELTDALARDDRDRIRHVAHQLLGAGGTYGFAVVTKVCRGLETAATRPAVPLAPHLEALGTVVRRITLAHAA
jgi:HPt (histidine-containing phosphotransfer) domain-containing protein